MKKLFIFAMFLSVMEAFAQEDLQGQIDLLRAELEQIKQAQAMPIPQRVSILLISDSICTLTSSPALMLKKQKEQI